MSGKAIYKQRDIVLTKFPFSNLTDYKVRPVLVLSKSGYNRQYADIVACAVTSNLEKSEYGVEISAANLEEGHLKLTSKIRVDAITSIEKEIIIKKIGKLDSKTFEMVLNKINSLFIE